MMTGNLKRICKRKRRKGIVKKTELVMKDVERKKESVFEKDVIKKDENEMKLSNR